MKRPLILMLFALASIASTCEADAPARIDPDPDGVPDPDVIVSHTLEGFVWMDENGDGVWTEGEKRVKDAVVELVPEDGREDQSQKIETDALGGYGILTLADVDYYLIFTLPKELQGSGFTTKQVKPDAIDSDVNKDGTTDWFTLTREFSQILSAGVFVPPPPEELPHVIIQDGLDGCSSLNSTEPIACPGDIDTCELQVDQEAETYEFTCTFGEVPDYAQIDFYIVVDTDGNPATGDNQDIGEGVDAEFYASGFDGSVQVDRYDAGGGFIGSEVLPPEIAQLRLGSEDTPEIGLVSLKLQSVDPINVIFSEDSIVSFIVWYFPHSGEPLFNQTGSLPGSFPYCC